MRLPACLLAVLALAAEASKQPPAGQFLPEAAVRKTRGGSDRASFSSYCVSGTGDEADGTYTLATGESSSTTYTRDSRGATGPRWMFRSFAGPVDAKGQRSGHWLIAKKWEKDASFEPAADVLFKSAHPYSIKPAVFWHAAPAAKSKRPIVVRGKCRKNSSSEAPRAVKAAKAAKATTSTSSTTSTSTTTDHVCVTGDDADVAGDYTTETPGSTDRKYVRRGLAGKKATLHRTKDGYWHLNTSPTTTEEERKKKEPEEPEEPFLRSSRPCFSCGPEKEAWSIAQWQVDIDKNNDNDNGSNIKERGGAVAAPQWRVRSGKCSEAERISVRCYYNKAARAAKRLAAAHDTEQQQQQQQQQQVRYASSSSQTNSISALQTIVRSSLDVHRTVLSKAIATRAPRAVWRVCSLLCPGPEFEHDDCKIAGLRLRPSFAAAPTAAATAAQRSKPMKKSVEMGKVAKAAGAAAEAAYSTAAAAATATATSSTTANTKQSVKPHQQPRRPRSLCVRGTGSSLDGSYYLVAKALGRLGLVYQKDQDRLFLAPSGHWYVGRVDQREAKVTLIFRSHLKLDHPPYAAEWPARGFQPAWQYVQQTMTKQPARIDKEQLVPKLPAVDATGCAGSRSSVSISSKAWFSKQIKVLEKILLKKGSDAKAGAAGAAATDMAAGTSEGIIRKKSPGETDSDDDTGDTDTGTDDDDVNLDDATMLFIAGVGLVGGGLILVGVGLLTIGVRLIRAEGASPDGDTEMTGNDHVHDRDDDGTSSASVSAALGWESYEQDTAANTGASKAGAGQLRTPLLTSVMATAEGAPVVSVQPHYLQQKA